MTEAPETVAVLGCGWLGLPLAGRLVELGWQVHGSTTRPERRAEIEARGVAAFVVRAEGQDVAAEPPGFFDARILVLDIPPRRQTAIAVAYPHAVAAIAARFFAAGGAHILFVSTTGVYAADAGEVDEAAPTEPDKESGLAVLAAERVLQAQAPERITILRLAGLVGPGRQPGAFLAGKRDLPDGGAPVNLVHLDDCIAAIEAILTQGRWGATYNLCADEHPSRAAFYVAQAQRQGLEPPTFIKESGTSGKRVSALRIQRELGLRLRHPDPMNF